MPLPGALGFKCDLQNAMVRLYYSTTSTQKSSRALPFECGAENGTKCCAAKCLSAVGVSGMISKVDFCTSLVCAELFCSFVKFQLFYVSEIGLLSSNIRSSRIKKPEQNANT